MKKYLLYLTTAFLTVHLAAAQVLYTEDFDNLTVGNVGTDITGQTLGQGGWYTLGAVNTGNNIVTNADFQIVPENTKGNILTINGASSQTQTTGRSVYRSDIETIWNQRPPGNDILKLAFDIYTGPPTLGNMIFGNYMYFTYGNGQLPYIFCNLIFDTTTKALQLYRQSSKDNTGLGFLSGAPLNYNSDLILPSDNWVTVELYIDYTGSKYYVSVPSLSHTVAFDFRFPMALTDPVNEGDPVNGTPKRLYFGGRTFINSIYYETKFDNINISATNIAPTVSVKDFISDKFNVFPNPVADIVTITNSENIGFEAITVYDLEGRIIKERKYNSENKTQLNLSNLATGVYLLHIKTKEGVAVKKIIKQ